jgi:hypothetical protein
MKKSLSLFLILIFLLAFAGMAHARGHWSSLTPQQFAAMQEIYADFHKRIQPMQQEMYAKQAELDAFRFRDLPHDDPGVQKLLREIEDLDAKLYAAHKEMRAQMNAKGVPFHSRGRSYGGMGPGHGGGGRCGEPGYFGSGGGCYL